MTQRIIRLRETRARCASEIDKSGFLAFLDVMFSALGVFIVILALQSVLVRNFQAPEVDLLIFVEGSSGITLVGISGEPFQGELLGIKDYDAAMIKEWLSHKGVELFRPLRLRVYVPADGFTAQLNLERAFEALARPVADVKAKAVAKLAVDVSWWPLASDSDRHAIIRTWRKQREVKNGS
jgi:hypothetical protein